MTRKMVNSDRGKARKPRLAVHKFSSCDGCQLALLNAGDELLQLSASAEFKHFAEMGTIDAEADVDIALVEGSISTPEDRERIQRIREHSRFLVTIGACATAGGIQALRNFANHDEWLSSIYPQPEYVSSLADVLPIRACVYVDLELWGCPVNGQQVLSAIGTLMSEALPSIPQESLCQECKRKQRVCVMVSQQKPCMGPVTRTGCGALCPEFGRDCYACFGPSEKPNTAALGHRFRDLGLSGDQIVKRFHFINNQAPDFLSIVKPEEDSGIKNA